MKLESIFPCEDVLCQKLGTQVDERRDEALQQGTRLAAETEQTTMPEMVDGRSSVCFGVPDHSTNNKQSEKT